MFFRLVNMSSKHTESDGCGKVNTTKQILVASSVVGLVVATAAVACGHHRRKIKMKNNQNAVIPRLERRESGRVGQIESFSHYVARQVGFGDGNKVCPQLCKLAYEYLRKEKGYEEDMYNYFTNEKDIALPDSLYVKLVDEFERCILSYFAFHWTHASLIITQSNNVQVLEEEIVKKTKLKHLVLSATRKQRFERVTKELRVKRVFWTLVEEMKAIGSITSKKESECTDVMVPVAHSQRSPVFLLIGGGMGAGKSTVLKDILKESFWSEASRNAVVVEADAFKESDVVYRALSSRGHHHDMLQTAELVHQSSTDAASSLLVTALNEGRDVIMDGTLSWEPFFQQTMAMARNVHKCRYRMGIGYKMAEDGTITENYWEQLNEEEEELEDEKKHNIGETSKRKPYKIELVGVVCDPYLAVVRGIRRAIMIGRAVRVKSQLKSHKRFASAFPIYCELVDNARLYCTNAVNGTPKLIARKDGDNKLLVEPEEYQWLEIVSTLNPDADSIYELYADSNLIHQASTWNDIVLSSSRPTLQNELRASIRKIETHNTV